MKKLLKISLLISTIALVIVPLLVLAQPQNPLDRLNTAAETSGLLINAEQLGGPQKVILNLVSYALGFLGIFFLISLIYAGWQWMSSMGEAEKIDKAKDRLKNSIIGIVIVLAAYLIANFVIDVWYKATCNPAIDYYCPTTNPNPTGDCRTDQDCEAQFGSSNWKCDLVEGRDYGSCKFEP